MSRLPSNARRGATLVETAIVLIMTIILFFGLFLVGMGVSYQQMVTCLAREATRTASVRGGQFREDNQMTPGSTTDWENDIYNSSTHIARWPSDVFVNVGTDLGLNPDRLHYTFTWSNGPGGNPDNYPFWTDSDGVLHGNTVQVRVTYDWFGFTLASTAKEQITF